MRPLLLGTALLLAVGAGGAAAQSPQFVPAFPLYCQGPLTTGAPSGGETTTPFIWAATGAGAAPPGPGQCVWADRPARGSEIQPGGGNVICDFSSAMKSVPTGTFVEVGVARDPLVNNCMHLARYIGTVSPPFSAIPALPPFVRQSIASLTPAQIASLQHGIQVMMSRPPSNPTSYRFQANIHGTLDSATTPQEMQSWNNCEHGSYYFLSWHRMYLYFFDRILRAAAIRTWCCHTGTGPIRHSVHCRCRSASRRTRAIRSSSPHPAGRRRWMLARRASVRAPSISRLPSPTPTSIRPPARARASAGRSLPRCSSTARTGLSKASHTTSCMSHSAG